MNSNPQPDALRSRWTLEGKIPLSGVADGAAWRRARSIATGEDVVLFIVQGETALEAADAVRRAYLIEDPHLLPVQDIVVFDDPRETSSPQPAAVSEDGPTTVVEYPLPPAPPLAALLTEGPLHPETARAIIGEAATGLEAARRRGVRHQFVDSNRVFVDPRSGTVVILGIGVEAAAHQGLDRSRETASFQDTASLVALLYRALTGRSPRHDASGDVPLPSTMVDTHIPEDLDLLCDLVLNESGDEIPETTRGLIEALQPWQSIPVTLEAYSRDGRHSGAEAPVPSQEAPPAQTVTSSPEATSSLEATSSQAVPSPQAAPSPQDEEKRIPEDGRDADGLESTSMMAAVPEQGSEDAGPPDEDTVVRTPRAAADPHSAAGTDAAEATTADAKADADRDARSADADTREGTSAAAAGMAGVTGAAGATGLVATSVGRDPEVERDGAPAGEAVGVVPGATSSRDQDGPPEEDSPRASQEAKALVEELHLDQKRDTSPFPGHLDITLPTRPQPDPEGDRPEDDGTAAGAGAAPGTEVAAGAGAVVAAGAAGAAAATTGDRSAHTADAQSSDRAHLSAGTPATAPGDIPSRSSGTHWPLGLAEGGEQPLAPQPSPDASGDRAQQPGPGPETSVSTPDYSAPTPSSPVTHSAGEAATAPVAVAGRTAPMAPVREDGPIVIHGRDRSVLEETPEETTVPSTRSSLLRDVVGVAVDNDAPETFTLGPRDQEKRSLQSQWIIIGGAIVVMIALVVALTSITSDVRDLLEDPLATSQPPTSPAPEEETGEAPVEPTAEATEDPALPAPELESIEMVAPASDLEPDNVDQQDRITDGDPATYWSTKHYGSPDYGGLKEGVGLRLHFAEPSTFTSVTLTTALNNGGSVELRAVNEDGTFGDVLATGEFVADGEVRLDAPEPVEAEEVALWIAELPPDSNESGRFRARIAEIRVE
ncbi:hypothetical protein [Brachybacterium sp.]|uniref:hypothetical protein n=1 Tax=Brachybacterium sp. TaxID=1891286 RepID=UPI002ED61736